MIEITVNIPGLKELAEAIALRGAGAPQGESNTAVQPTLTQLTPQAEKDTVSQPVFQNQQMPTQQTVQPSQTPPTPAQVPTSTASYTLDDLARAAMTLMDSGRQADLQGLLAQFGVEALPALPQAQFGAFATALRGMGAQI